MLATEARRERTLLKRIHDCVRGSEELFEDDPHSYTREKRYSGQVPRADTGEVDRTSEDFSEEEKVNGLVNGALTTLVWILWV